ncbi:MAG TPA: MBL fold metallo-hydrolase [Chloroflexota bacterium]|nr:MBL fold metallo-hydrolase [Chloroflexota bacterium]HZU05850.1 MBL fold metallo-hydrolase [Chloroflexota bacterium]
MAQVPLAPVDRVEVLSLMDNSIDVLMANTPIARRAGRRKDAFRRPQLRAEHGVSMLVTVEYDGRRDTLLFDTGTSPDGVLHNLTVLEVDLADVRALVLSHGHTDHTAGLVGLLNRYGRWRLPIVVHPDAFRQRRNLFPDGSEVELIPPHRQDLEREGIELVIERGPSFLLEGHVLITGEIERTTAFEKGLPTQQAWIDGAWQPDPWIHDDQAIVIHLRGKGLVVLTGCGHAGVINTLRHARRLTGVEPVYAVIGGFHLTGSLFEPIIAPTVAALKEIAPAVVVPQHCTGWKAHLALARELPDAYVPNSVGTRLELGAEPPGPAAP